MARPGVRSKTGCFTCRQRKKKCNEEKPTCSGCRRNCLKCTWPSTETSSRGGRRSSKETVSSAWQVLQPSPTQTITAPLSPTQRRISQATSGSHHDDAVTAPSSSPGSRTAAQPDQQFPSSSMGSLPSFLVMDFASTQAEPQTYSATTDSDEWDGMIGGDVDGDHLPSDEYLSLGTSGFDASLPLSPPVAETIVVGQPGHEQDCILLSTDQGTDTGNAEITMDAAAEEIFLDHLPVEEDCVEPENPDTSTIGTRTGTSDSLSLVTPPSTISLFSQQDPDAFHLLSFYLSRTANSMGNGSTDMNPFLSTLVPLAFSNHLVLQLILAQSAVHRQVGQVPCISDQVAQRYYTQSLRLFHSAIGDYMAGKSSDKLILTTGSLILSLTEVARGDIDGTIFDHIIAAKSLLLELSLDSVNSIPSDLMDFLVEYYTHMSVLSMISADTQRHTNSLLDTTIETLARRLIDKKYVGQLAGCWLELLVMIPHIFDLGQRMRGSGRPSADDITLFGMLQAQIMAFEPRVGVSEDTRLASLVFKKAVSLYLWSILGTRQEEDDVSQTTANRSSLHSNLMTTAVTEAISLLGQLPDTSRVNTSLCWPLAIIGCCTTEKSLQAILRTRLRTMFSCIGLGNMGETLLMLEKVWGSSSSEQRSPWALSELMREQRRWISFA